MVEELKMYSIFWNTYQYMYTRNLNHNVYIHICLCLCVYVCACVCVRVNIYIYIYICILFVMSLRIPPDQHIALTSPIEINARMWPLISSGFCASTFGRSWDNWYSDRKRTNPCCLRGMSHSASIYLAFPFFLVILRDERHFQKGVSYLEPFSFLAHNLLWYGVSWFDQECKADTFTAFNLCLMLALQNFVCDAMKKKKNRMKKGKNDGE